MLLSERDEVSSRPTVMRLVYRKVAAVKKIQLPLQTSVCHGTTFTFLSINGINIANNVWGHAASNSTGNIRCDTLTQQSLNHHQSEELVSVSTPAYCPLDYGFLLTHKRRNLFCSPRLVLWAPMDVGYSEKWKGHQNAAVFFTVCTRIINSYQMLYAIWNNETDPLMTFAHLQQQYCNSLEKSERVVGGIEEYDVFFRNDSRCLLL